MSLQIQFLTHINPRAALLQVQCTVQVYDGCFSKITSHTRPEQVQQFVVLVQKCENGRKKSIRSNIVIFSAAI